MAHEPDEIKEILPPPVVEASEKAVHAAKNAAQAVEMARALQAAALHETTTQSIAEALRQVFGEYTEQQRFVDLKRVPLICKQIENIDYSLTEIRETLKSNNDKFVNQDQFWPVKTLVYGVVGLMLTGVVTALLALVLITANAT